jgi:membrane-associated protein
LWPFWPISQTVILCPSEAIVSLFSDFLQVVLHLNNYLPGWAHTLGPTLYVVLFLVIFCETGLVVTPFLPGDSLLFAVGAVCSMVDPSTHTAAIDIRVVVPLLLTAAISGDLVNYTIGRFIGPRIFSKETGRLLNKKHLLRTQAFYERHGGKAIVIARFAPILRTFAPFVAGIGQMRFRRFISFSVAGGASWISSFSIAGYYFGENAVVKRNFHLVIIAIVVISLMPAVIEFLRSRQHRGPAARRGGGSARHGPAFDRGRCLR